MCMTDPEGRVKGRICPHHRSTHAASGPDASSRKHKTIFAKCSKTPGIWSYGPSKRKKYHNLGTAINPDGKETGGSP